MMKKIIAITVLLIVHCSLLISQTISQLFVTMPEEKTPLLTLNDKKEMIECWNQKLDTSVRNKLDGTSRIDTLTDDCIKVHLSDAKTITLFIERKVDQPARIGLITTLYSPKGESKLEWFATDWTALRDEPNANRVEGISSPDNQAPTAGLSLLEYTYDPQTKEIKTIYNYPLKGKQIDE